MRFLLIILFILSFSSADAQVFLQKADSGQSNRLEISGYFQPQLQVASAKGVKTYSGGDFKIHSNNRFMLRRSRIKLDFVHLNMKEKPSVRFIFQLDATERGVSIKDMYGKVFDNKLQLFSLTAGVFARPFGYEVNFSSSKRESPERGRMSQILMKSERDVGAMISLETEKEESAFKNLLIEAGIFNGQGLIADGDYDSHKDFITRIKLKPFSLSKKVSLSAGASYLNGGILQTTKYVYSIKNGSKSFTTDSSENNLGEIAPRKYYGADAQLKIKNNAGFTEFRGEFITGKQTSFANFSETPSRLAAADENLFTRNFRGGYFYFIQQFEKLKAELVVKYDWYDPNIAVKGKEIGNPGSNLAAGDITYSTLGFGLVH